MKSLFVIFVVLSTLIFGGCESDGPQGRQGEQ